ncbi:MAG: LicD family protein [Holdemanella sp.]|nr:LicD family protein [Holdemanella sp.]
MIENFDLKRLQQEELDILDELMRVCKEYNLTLFISGGSLLGAIRHKGFIPWDDDIDLGMPRKDYEKLVKIAPKALKESYVLQDNRLEKKCGLNFGKIRKKGTIMSENYSHHIDMSQGIWIDIFPYDKVSNDEKVRKKNMQKLSFYRNMYIIKSGYKAPEGKSKAFYAAYHIAKMASVFYSIDYLIEKVNSIMMEYENQDTDYVFPYGGAYPDRDLMPKRIIEHLKPVMFEGREILAFEDYDYYLKSLYKNYMELPPVEKRVNGSQHTLHEIKFSQGETK